MTQLKIANRYAKGLPLYNAKAPSYDGAFDMHYANSIIAISAASPRRGPILMILVDVYKRQVYERYTDQVEPYGMDECWLDISGTESLFGSPEKVANEIRETMKFELGLTISVGVSFNKIFAKLGSDMKKPDAVTVIPKDTFKEKIWGLPAADLLGVGRATQRTLDSYCIRTIGDLANTDPVFLRRTLGKNGVVLWNYANGNDISLVAKKDFVSPIKSVGHGITTVEDLENPEQVLSLIHIYRITIIKWAEMQSRQNA